MKKITLLFFLLLSFSLVFAQTIYLDAGPNVPADSPQGQEVISYSWGSVYPDGSQEITISMLTGSMSPALYLAVAEGSSFTKMDLKFYDSQNQLVSRFTFFNVFAVSYQTSGTTDQVTLLFSRSKMKEFNR